MTGSLYRYHWLCLLLILGGVFTFYTPALQSLFLLDDLYILRDLDVIPSTGVFHFIFKGESGPTGRPVALLTFALQAQHWPDPFWFKLVNLAIHLINGILVYLLCRLVSVEFIPDNNQRTVFCLLVAGLWLIHPLQTTTVLYVIQRMTLLATTFMLAAILLFLHSWAAYNRGYIQSAMTGLFISFAVIMPVAVFTKEVGILTGLYVYILYSTLLARNKKGRPWHVATTVAALLPVALVLLYYLITMDFIEAYSNRSFTLCERLLTEPGILLEYLRKILVPVPGQYSLFHDDYPLSTSLLSPPLTIFNILCVLALIVAAAVYRRKYPVPSFAVLWFFSGHVLESGFIPLELYFEHRNYLPSMGIIFLLVWCLYCIYQYLKTRLLSAILTFIYTGLIIVIAVTELLLWSNPLVQAIVWKEHHPQSTRAMEYLWDVYLLDGQFEKTESLYHEYRRVNPHNLYPLIRRVNEMTCHRQTAVDQKEWDRIISFAAHAQYYGVSIQSIFYDVLDKHFTNKCRIPDPGHYSTLLGEIAQNKNFYNDRGKLYELAAVFSVLSADLKGALANINRALQYNPSISNKIFKIRLLIGLGEPARAQQVKQGVEKKLANDYRKNLIYRKSLDDLVIKTD